MLVVRSGRVLGNKRQSPAPVAMGVQDKFEWNINVGRSPFGFADNAEVRTALLYTAPCRLSELLAAGPSGVE